MQVAATIAIGLLVAAAVWGLVRLKSDLDVWWRAVVGAVCSGLIAGLAAGDLLISGQGQWWADRPMFAAGISSVLLLGLTVLVVEAIIENGNTLLRRVAAKDPVRRTLAEAVSAHAVVKGVVDGQSGDGRVTLTQIPDVLEGIVVRTRTITPLLTASTELLSVYEHAEAFADAASKLRGACGDYRDTRDGVDGAEQLKEGESTDLRSAYLESEKCLTAFWFAAAQLKFVDTNTPSRPFP